MQHGTPQIYKMQLQNLHATTTSEYSLFNLSLHQLIDENKKEEKKYCDWCYLRYIWIQASLNLKTQS
jgi:hypothetical protein